MGLFLNKSSSKLKNYYDIKNETTVIHVRVSQDEKEYLNKMAKIHGENTSAFIRRLIFDVYKNDLSQNKNVFIDKYLQSKWVFDTNRTESIHIRFTFSEKGVLTKMAESHSRTISNFIRWVVLQVYLDDFIVTS